jgi:hypothetical protein
MTGDGTLSSFSIYCSLATDHKKGYPLGIAFWFYKLLLNGVNRNLFPVLAHSLKLNFAVNKSIECVVRTDANIVARVNVRSSLAIKNIACKNELTVSSLCAKALGFGITAVLGGTHTLFMSEKL